ncbi:DNA cytosine methyltransferase [Janthinobacterium lividum]|uniref:DNA (cytosine-5-)-methyltransferase n=1 Tax=Janthinobacterium lividum TaxID=29581 RepID=A0ABU0XNE2_9BURK|nr:DNA cytosine methyltransferase [Janthinobacterium lividum]MDQ4625040.1 DNA cytosine methyltransferase [Janthinobacterium lividum]MDQ4673357.1 DNA cytosine methyltransferase [Janthinobacterium lividum]MDQ4684087.1 DNA cytosine methyltransferase [Janthinobacterium lividum]
MKRDAFTLSLDLGSELIIDNFAGGGGTSTGLEQAFGRPVDIAINHDPEALAMHAANHPHTTHLCESVWDVDPIKVTNNRPVGLVWLSPDCKHFSKAKGGKPVEKKIRGLAWVTLRWAAKCKPRVIMLENVEEFKTWGPLLIAADGSAKPDPAKKGKTFDSFIRQLRAHGYTVDYREMRGCDHDTPTIRKRFFLVARRDGIAIQWPEPTHGAPDSIGVRAGKLLPYRTAAECIDFSLPCPSIFERDRPLAPATLRRIAKGIMRYVVDSADPFIVGQGGPIYGGKPVSANQPFGTLTTENHRAVVLPTIIPVTHQGGDRTESIDEPFRTITGAHRGEKALGVATLVQVGYGEREGQAPRALDIEKPLGTVVGESKHALVSAALIHAGVKRWFDKVMLTEHGVMRILFSYPFTSRPGHRPMSAVAVKCKSASGFIKLSANCAIAIRVPSSQIASCSRAEIQSCSENMILYVGCGSTPFASSARCTVTTEPSVEAIATPAKPVAISNLKSMGNSNYQKDSIA